MPMMNPNDSRGHWDPALLRYALSNHSLLKESPMKTYSILETTAVPKESHRSPVHTFADPKQLHSQFIKWS